MIGRKKSAPKKSVKNAKKSKSIPKKKKDSQKWTAFEYNTRELKQTCEPKYYATREKAEKAAVEMKLRHRKGSVPDEVCLQMIAKVNPKTFSVDGWRRGECARNAVKVRTEERK